jgi:Protein of unknown function (DUF3489)
MTKAETTATAADKTAKVAELCAPGAPEKAGSKKVPGQNKGAVKRPQTSPGKGKRTAPKKAKARQAVRAQNVPTARPASKRSIVLDLIRQPKGATLADLRTATGWQAHYADVQIMPTCVGNPVRGAGIAAMESA